MKIGPFVVNGTPTYTATYINKVDLNLARVHQSVTYGPNQTNAVVCNHLGATDFFNPTQPDIDNAVENAAANKDLVACVAMDYTISPGVNSNQPFIRFYIFGPNGQLLPSVNLDGRREKFVPGTCVVCHGGDHYAGKFPEDGTGFANVGGHFLPYDAGNFEFASKTGLQKCDQEDAIYHLNQNILNGGPTQSEKQLINGWYTTKRSVVPGDGRSRSERGLRSDELGFGSGPLSSEFLPKRDCAQLPDVPHGHGRGLQLRRLYKSHYRKPPAPRGQLRFRGHRLRRPRIQ
jgi:hypothetical protein